MAKTSPAGIVVDAATVFGTEQIEQAILQRYSPFPELTMSLLAQQLNEFRVGALRNPGRTWEIMFERDGELSGPALQRYADAARLPWDIEKTETSKEADAHAEALRYFYENLTATNILEQDENGGANLLFRQMMTAKAYRYSVHEILLRVNSAAKREVTAQFNHCPVYFFESRRGRLAYLKNVGEYTGTPLEYGRWLPAVGEGLMRQCSVLFGIKHFALRDNMLYASRFGLPGIHGETDAQIGTKEWDAFVGALKAFANDWITATNRGAKINLIEAAKGGSGTLPFAELIERADRCYARLFRGGDLNAKSREGTDVTGASLQGDEKRVMQADDAQWLTDTLNARVDEPVIAYLFNATPKAWIRVRPPKQTDAAKERENLLAARDLKVPVSIGTARERLGLPAPQDGEELIGGGQPSDPTALGNAAPAEFAAAVAEDLAPVIQAVEDRLQSILAITDPALRKLKWDQAWAELAALRKDILADPKSARVLEQFSASAFARGVTQNQNEK